MHTCTHARAHTHARTQTHTRTHTRARRGMHVRKRIHARTRARAHACTHANAGTYAHALTHTRVHMLFAIRRVRQVSPPPPPPPTHTHTHTYTQCLPSSFCFVFFWFCKQWTCKWHCNSFVLFSVLFWFSLMIEIHSCPPNTRIPVKYIRMRRTRFAAHIEARALRFNVLRENNCSATFWPASGSNKSLPFVGNRLFPLDFM